MKVDILNLPLSEIEIKVELDPKEWGEFVDEAVKDLAREAKIEGFRPGHVPREILEQRLGMGKILEKAAESTVKKTYVELITEKKIQAIGRPEIQVLKVAANNPFEFKVKVAVMPQVKLGDWRMIAKEAQKEKQKKFSVEEKEKTDALSWLQKSRTKFVTVTRAAKTGDRVEVDFMAKKGGQIIEEGTSKNHPVILGENSFVPGFEEKLSGMLENEEKKFSLVFPIEFQNKELAGQSVDFEVKIKLVQEAQIPDLDDNFAKSLGKFDDFKALEKNIIDGLIEEKKQKAKDVWRAKVLDGIIKESEMDLPEILVELELTKMFEELKDSVARLGLEFDAYLKNINKTLEDLKKDWQEKARQRVKAALILQEIGEKEMVKISDSEIEREINHILTHYPDIDSTKDQIDIERLKEYTRGRLINEKVFELFENI